jgi:uncharacterized protein
MAKLIVRGLFALFLVAGVPVLSFATARPARLRTVPRAVLYVSAVLSQCLLAALGALVVWATLPSFSMAGLRVISIRSFWHWTAALTLASFSAVAVMALLERLDWWPEESEVSRLLLPETRRERALAVLLVAPSAGFCEELLYRGYLLPQLSQYLGSDAWGWAASSVAFGLAHSYQGVGGVLQAGALGALLAYPMMRLGSVYPSMAVHFLIDALLLAWLGRKLLRPRTDSASRSAAHEGQSAAPTQPDTHRREDGAE